MTYARMFKALLFFIILIFFGCFATGFAHGTEPAKAPAVVVQLTDVQKKDVQLAAKDMTIAQQQYQLAQHAQQQAQQSYVAAQQAANEAIAKAKADLKLDDSYVFDGEKMAFVKQDKPAEKK